MKEFNVSRHFKRKHEYYHKYGPDEKMEIYKSLISKYLDMKTNFAMEMSKSELVTLASLKFSWIILKYKFIYFLF